MSTRKYIPLKIQLAAALLQLVDERGERLVSHEHAKLMSADQIISLYQMDHHPVRVADGGEDVHWNLTWRLRAEHKRKTATIDQPQLAKQRRIRAREDEHKAKRQVIPSIVTNDISSCASDTFLSKWGSTIIRKIPSRPFPKGRKFG